MEAKQNTIKNIIIALCVVAFIAVFWLVIPVIAPLIAGDDTSLLCKLYANRDSSLFMVMGGIFLAVMAFIIIKSKKPIQAKGFQGIFISSLMGSLNAIFYVGAIYYLVKYSGFDNFGLSFSIFMSLFMWIVSSISIFDHIMGKRIEDKREYRSQCVLYLVMLPFMTYVSIHIFFGQTMTEKQEAECKQITQTSPAVVSEVSPQS